MTKGLEVTAGVATYTGYSYGGSLGEGDDTQRLRQDVFLWSNVSEFHLNNFTFMQVDSQRAGPRSFYGETNVWFGHKSFPVDLAYQSVFSSAGSDKGWVGLNLRISDIPYIDAACKAVGLFAYVQVHPLGFDYSNNSTIPTVYTEYFYTLDPLKEGIRPRLVGFVDHLIDYNGEQTVNTEHRLEAVLPLLTKEDNGVNLEASLGVEWRRYGFLSGSERDKESIAGLASIRTSL